MGVPPDRRYFLNRKDGGAGTDSDICGNEFNVLLAAPFECYGKNNCCYVAHLVSESSLHTEPRSHTLTHSLSYSISHKPLMMKR